MSQILARVMVCSGLTRYRSLRTLLTSTGGSSNRVLDGAFHASLYSRSAVSNAMADAMFIEPFLLVSPRECAHCCQALGGSVAQTLKTLGHQSRCAAGSPGILLSIEAKVACSVATTCAPSPTAAATRLIEPERTSPIAKIPRRLVSSGLRVSLQSPPISTKPFASNATPDPALPRSQARFGSMGASKPMPRASSGSVGLRKSCPPGQSTIGN